MSHNNGSTLRTSDLALATFLEVSGYRYTHLEKEMHGEDHLCYWVFESSEEARQLVEDFLSRRARVEPYKFVRRWGSIREEMIDFLYHKD
jgi:hypothetical protein